MKPTNHVIAIFGPTTSNKLGIAIDLSKYIYGKHRLQSEIINTDSKKIYKGFDISQHLPKPELIKNIPIHLFQYAEPKRVVDLYEFKDKVYATIDEIHSRNAVPILVGGSTLHTLAIIYNWSRDDELKKQEVNEKFIVLGTSINRKLLKNRIKNHVDNMISEGLYDEFKNLYLLHLRNLLDIKILETTIGYKEFLELSRIKRCDPLDLNTGRDMEKIKEWIYKDLVKFAFTQEVSMKKFKKISIIKDSSDAKLVIDREFSQ
jgi:tRNA A37 N6-isopentenylltransferase MiaA